MRDSLSLSKGEAISRGRANKLPRCAWAAIDHMAEACGCQLQQLNTHHGPLALWNALEVKIDEHAQRLNNRGVITDLHEDELFGIRFAAAPLAPKNCLRKNLVRHLHGLEAVAKWRTGLFPAVLD